jgi:hypothetical protein
MLPPIESLSRYQELNRSSPKCLKLLTKDNRERKNWTRTWLGETFEKIRKGSRSYQKQTLHKFMPIKIAIYCLTANWPNMKNKKYNLRGINKNIKRVAFTTLKLSMRGDWHRWQPYLMLILPPNIFEGNGRPQKPTQKETPLKHTGLKHHPIKHFGHQKKTCIHSRAFNPNMFLLI